MNGDDIYQKTLDYLYQFVDFSLTRGSRYTAEEFDLGRMRDLVARLDHPELKYPVIHIAGTKGKGSVAAMCQSVLAEAGYKTGLYTSPHLHDYAERIRVNGENIPHEDLIALVEELKPVLESLPKITTFEITTALAFIYFARQNCDAAVIEVGLGGRLDATNVVIPEVSVITSISYDHTFLLGDTLAEIAGEKAGIIKPGIPVVVSPQVEEARAAIRSIALERSAPIIEVGMDYLYQRTANSLKGQSFAIWTPAEQQKMDYFLTHGSNGGWEPVQLLIPLLGHHQVQNAATAYAALQTVDPSVLSIGEAELRRGFSQTRWPGRFEVVQENPPVVIDCAHNRDSAAKLLKALDEYFPGTPIECVFGASEDKDISGMFSELMPRIKNLIVTKSYHPRAIELEKLVELAAGYGKPVSVIQDIPEALDEAIKAAGDDCLVLVTGSIFVAAGAREAWSERTGTSLAV